MLMAMRKEPARRYVSVSALASDVKAYLTGYPVHARTDTWNYRSGKFVRRHRAAVAAAVTVTLALVGFSIGMGILAKRATRERLVAQRERLAAQRESQFLEGIFDASTPQTARGQQITARELLDQGAKRVDRELAGDPELQGTMLDAIGRAYSLGLYDQAEPLLERAYALRRKTLGDGSAEVADTLVNLATSIRLQGKYAKAEPLFRQALAIRERILGEHMTRPLPRVFRLSGNVFTLRTAMPTPSRYYEKHWPLIANLTTTLFKKLSRFTTEARRQLSGGSSVAARTGRV